MNNNNKKPTEFQSSVTKQHLIEICQILHTELTQSQLDQLKFSTKFTWITVDFSVKDYGYISFGIDNHHSTLWGKGITKEIIAKSLKTGNINFKIWRFVNDELINVDTKKDEMMLLLAKKYIEKNYKLPTVDEFHQKYYED